MAVETAAEPTSIEDVSMDDARAPDAPAEQSADTSMDRPRRASTDAQPIQKMSSDSVEEVSAELQPTEEEDWEEPACLKLRKGRVPTPMRPQRSPQSTCGARESNTRTAQLEAMVESLVPSDEPMQVDQSMAVEDQPSEVPAPVEEEKAEDDEPDEPVRIIIIETLDTPALRREKNLQKRLEKERKRAEAAAAAEAERAAQARATSAVAGPSHHVDEDSKSDMSDLSDLTDAEGAGAGEVEEKEPGVVVLTEGESLEGGTLVWAKAKTFPWWPAVVFESDDPAIPKRIKGLWSGKQAADGPLHIVQFFDRHNSWQCLQLDKLRLLGENQELDQDMLATVSKMQKWKTPKLLQQCREAFRRAMAERETDKEGTPQAETPAAGSGMDVDL
ncbi:uncharacterized protein B0H18DRAFT_1116943 [Fomitopsis serialis]|uniref:uncharacterized protein n=1 Tax=Fomitopsis serialis TaxID=139415 RepID=UPI0020085B3D|nr:uncharacterized protein B0H18DRAFT_1116943 [Neoantrodia serialis]KAH9930247.1 hypothetical protein B0H18DRAFT_1116943 [Neoantrodia serialis]